MAFVSPAVANVISHEIGHYIGNYHTENTNGIHNLMDAGGANFGENLYGVGPGRNRRDAPTTRTSTSRQDRTTCSRASPVGRTP